MAATYDRRWSHYVEASAAATLARLDFSAISSVLDIGCGTGVMLAALAGRSQARLHGIDPVREMLRVAQARLSAGARLVQGSGGQLPYRDESFDLVLSCSVFHYLRQPAQAAAEFHRVLKPGGRVIVTDWCADYWTCRALDLWLRIFNAAHFRTYRQQECAALFERAGFCLLSAERYKIDWFWGLMTITGTRA